MDKSFSISGYLLSRLQPDDPQEARLRMLCVTISKDMPEERRERQLRPFASDMEFMNMIAGWMNGLPEAISHELPVKQNPPAMLCVCKYGTRIIAA